LRVKVLEQRNYGLGISWDATGIAGSRFKSNGFASKLGRIADSFNVPFHFALLERLLQQQEEVDGISPCEVFREDLG